VFSHGKEVRSLRALQAAAGLLLLLVLCLLSRSANAQGLHYGSGWSSWSFDGGLFEGSTISDSSSIAWTLSPEIQWSHSFQSGLNEASAQMGLGRTFTNNSITLAVAPGTGLSQYAPDGGNSPATLNIDFNIEAESSGRNGEILRDIIGWYNVPLTATVPSGSWASASFTATFTGVIGTYADPGYAIAFQQTVSSEWTKTAPGTEQHTLADSIALPDLMGEFGAGWPGYDLGISGRLSLTVKNDGGPVTIEMPGGFSLCGQGTLISNGAEWISPTGGKWGEATNWSPQLVPDGPDACATVGMSLTSPDSVDLESTSRTVGSLGFFGGQASCTIIATGSTPGSLRLQSTTGNALVRFTQYNQQDNEIAAPVELLSDTIFELGEHTLTISGTLAINDRSIELNGGTLDVVHGVEQAGTISVTSGTLITPRISADSLIIGGSPFALAHAVPEPSTLAVLLTASLGGLLCWRRR
jgi:hypothetical protein